jgi:glycosyltransferase involved in cell wall biosynthesis
MTSEQPDVTVVIPAYNAAETIGEALRSVLAQTYRRFEALVIDDGSNDATPQIAGGSRDERVKVISVPNGGVAKARNLGIQEARGEFVAFLDADDVWLPWKLDRQVAALRSNPAVGLCFTGARRVDSGLRPIGDIPANGYRDYCEALLLHANIVSAGSSSVVMRRGPLQDAGSFDPRFSQCADWELWLRLSRRIQFLPISEPGVLYRVHEARMSRDIALLERDTFAVLNKFFADPGSAAYLPLRARVCSNHWMICSGSYLHAGQLVSSLRCLVRGLIAYPPNIGRPLMLPRRWLMRLTARTESTA